VSHLIRSQQVSFRKNSRNETNSANASSDVLAEINAGPANLLNEAYQIEQVPSNTQELLDVELNTAIAKEKALSFDEGKRVGIEEGIDIGTEKGKLVGVAEGKRLAHLELESEYKELKREREELNELNSNIKSLIESINKKIEADVLEFEAYGVEIVYEVLLKILGEKAEERQLINAVLQQCLKKCLANNIVKIRVSTQDYEVLTDQRSENALPTNLRNIEFMPDMQILPGGCIVETDAGSLDARLDEQLTSFKSLLLKTFERRDSDGACQ